MKEKPSIISSPRSAEEDIIPRYPQVYCTNGYFIGGDVVIDFGHERKIYTRRDGPFRRIENTDFSDLPLRHKKISTIKSPALE